VGRGGAANAGVAATEAPLIAYLDDDDVFHPVHLELLCGVLQRHPEFGAAHADVDVARLHFNDASGDFELSSRRPAYTADMDADRLLYENTVPSIALVHRRELWERIGGFDGELELLEDWDFVLRLAAEASFVHVPRRTSEYRIREGLSVSTRRAWGGADEQRLREAIFLRHRGRYEPQTQLRVFEQLKHAAAAAGEAAAESSQRATSLEGELARSRAELALPGRTLTSRPSGPRSRPRIAAWRSWTPRSPRRTPGARCSATRPSPSATRSSRQARRDEPSPPTTPVGRIAGRRARPSAGRALVAHGRPASALGARAAARARLGREPWEPAAAPSGVPQPRTPTPGQGED
jgi:hypothetical protein